MNCVLSRIRNICDVAIFSLALGNFTLQPSTLLGDPPIVIAHRGASGYLPEHTQPAVALAHGMRADYIEQDVVLTKDHEPVVLHDIHVDTVTDVATVFPRRARADGRFYAIDFTLAELRRLRVKERVQLPSGKPVYPGRFPVGKARFSIPTLAEEIELIQGLNLSTGRDVGIYTEIKAPAWHRQQGFDISKIVLQVLAEYGYATKQHAVYVQCFDFNETRRIRRELKCQLKLVQLLGSNDWGESVTDFDQLRTKEGLVRIARVADGIGPWLPFVVTDTPQPQVTELVENAHKLGLKVHPFTFRADSLPRFGKNLNEVLTFFYSSAGVDGVFTDFPDKAVRARESWLSQQQAGKN